MHATLLAAPWSGGPGPWILLVPLFWISVGIVVRKVLRRRFGRGPGRGFGPGFGAGPGMGRGHGWGGYGPGAAPTPVETLNRKYADGEIDEFEYRQRYDLLTASSDPADPAPAEAASAKS
ncbi:SHOCT domain-containing protein [Streptacidiphilus sp. PB12-B1b]|uniref:SHOCT domain-containing protein n=1 Tax=Streptacidiphilus sp. PB12-B1b TaxID=2705012 RepID=UPI0015F926D0|nr:SHOCT domain-containing protein [Streptacidiphilus sp. PB12-B1b]QMU76295.1 SHOCT domain-containing protein [Streptacidiphilus sp. PB12-B1b]